MHLPTTRLVAGQWFTPSCAPTEKISGGPAEKQTEKKGAPIGAQRRHSMISAKAFACSVNCATPIEVIAPRHFLDGDFALRRLKKVQLREIKSESKKY
jgi:hypothetical protein